MNSEKKPHCDQISLCGDRLNVRITMAAYKLILFHTNICMYAGSALGFKGVYSVAK